MRLVFVGFGTVARGLCELLIEQRAALLTDHGFTPTVAGIATLSRGAVRFPAPIEPAAALEIGSGASGFTSRHGTLSKSGMSLIHEADADVVVETTFTDLSNAQPATDHIRSALDRRLHVVTSNKGPMALHSHDLIDLAAANGVHLLYEGTVMAGTPLVNLIRESLAGAGIREIRGILNGTTNYILSEMEHGRDYATALARAQDLGFAEAVPDADVLGHDALAKVTILANCVFGARLTPDDCPCRGITDITPEAIVEAADRGRRYRLIGRVVRDQTGIQASVGPQLVDVDHPLAAVTGAGNAVTVATDALGEVTVAGPGAGGRETGFGLLNDLLHIHRRG